MSFDNTAKIALFALLIASVYWLLEVLVFSKSRLQKPSTPGTDNAQATPVLAETAQTVIFFAGAVVLVKTLGYVTGIISTGIACVVIVIIDFVFFHKQRQLPNNKKKPPTLVEYARFFTPIGLLLAAVLKFGILPTVIAVTLITGVLFIRGMIRHNNTDTTTKNPEGLAALVQFSLLAFPAAVIVLAILLFGIVVTAVIVSVISAVIIISDLATHTKNRSKNKGALPVRVEYSRLTLPIALIALAIKSLDLALVLFLLSIATGLIWLVDYFYLAKKRATKLQADGQPTPLPVVVEFSRFLFPVVAVVLIIRSFIVEPFQIPSESMLPTLEKGDFILVNRFAYGLRLPVLNYKILEKEQPKRGDVIVFRYPKDPSLDYIKRVVGLPGDRIRHVNKQLYINGKLIERVEKGKYLKSSDTLRFLENLDGVEHSILERQNYAPQFSFLPENVEKVVPEHMYFAMGDNRDNSGDSRVWGFVPEENLKGRAFFIWFSWQENVGPKWARIGTSIK